MTYHNRWIGYEEGHEEYRLRRIGKHEAVSYEEPVWVTDFFLRVDSQALRVDYKGRGVNIFWVSFIRPKRWRVLRSSVKDALRLLMRRLHQNAP